MVIKYDFSIVEPLFASDLILNSGKPDLSYFSIPFAAVDFHSFPRYFRNKPIEKKFPSRFVNFLRILFHFALITVENNEAVAIDEMKSGYRSAVMKAKTLQKKEALGNAVSLYDDDITNLHHCRNRNSHIK